MRGTHCGRGGVKQGSRLSFAPQHLSDHAINIFFDHVASKTKIERVEITGELSLHQTCSKFTTQGLFRNKVLAAECFRDYLVTADETGVAQALDLALLFDPAFRMNKTSIVT